MDAFSGSFRMMKSVQSKTHHSFQGVSRVVVLVVVVIVLIAVIAGAYFVLSSTGSTTSTSASTSTSNTSSRSTSISTSSSSTCPTSSISSSSGGLILFSADAYTAEATLLESGFHNQSGVTVLPPTAAGSLTLAQNIKAGDPVSVFLSVSKTAVQPASLGCASSGWAISFASDQMTIAYSNASMQNSAAMKVINAFNTASASNTTQDWYNFYNNLTSGTVQVGISNPNSDPAGYRAWLVLQAAGHFFANNNSYFVDRMLTNKGNTTASSAANLLSPLESGSIQFLFIYKSTVVSQKLNYFQLTKAVNLGSPPFATVYSQFTYNTTSGLQKGGPIALYITVPSDSTDPADSANFVVYVIKNAPTLLAPFALQNITPAKLYNDTSVPQPIQQLVANGTVTLAGPL